MGLYNRPLILAHRCVYPGYPENTLLSLKKAVDEGCDYVEIDCLYSKDHEMVVSHDDTVDRCTNGKGLIKELLFSDLRKLDAGMGERIPTVEEVIAFLAPKSIRAELHIKDMNVLDIDKHPDNNIYELLLKYDYQDRANVNIDVVEPAVEIMNHPKYGKSKFRFSYSAYSFTEEILKKIRQIGFFGIDVGKENLDRKGADLIHQYELEIQTYPVNDEDWMKKMIEADADVIQTDYMDILKNIMLKRRIL